MSYFFCYCHMSQVPCSCNLNHLIIVWPVSNCLHHDRISALRISSIQYIVSYFLTLCLQHHWWHGDVWTTQAVLFRQSPGHQQSTQPFHLPYPLATLPWYVMFAVSIWYFQYRRYVTRHGKIGHFSTNAIMSQVWKQHCNNVFLRQISIPKALIFHVMMA